MSQFSQQDIKSNKIKFQDITDAFNSYWQTRDPMAKGSGYKPFKRWENYWKSYVNQDGYLPSKAFLWQTLQDKNQMSSARSTKAVSNWQPMGPFSHTNTGSWSSGQGMVNVLVVDPNNPNTSKDLESNMFYFYPNPTGSDITVKLPKPSDFNVFISDVTGKVIIRAADFSSTDQFVVPMKPVAAGLYFLTIEFLNGQKVTKKLIKK